MAQKNNATFHQVSGLINVTQPLLSKCQQPAPGENQRRSTAAHFPKTHSFN